ncbi:PAS domain S-box protein, partial [Sulfurihydrogenibium azorense]|uniref:PAS domain S-box protein n=1 Tax=Sulfurihydrogenibium azorense TaxID=309806 RepID=UPI00391A5E63
MNKKAKDVFGNLIGNDIVTIIPEKDWGYLYSKLLKDKKVEKLKVTDGERVFEVSGSYIISDIKEFRGKIKLLLRDISKEKEDQNIILKELQTYKSILDSIEDMIIIYQADNGRIKMFNRSVMKKLGYTQEELKNMTIFDIVEEDKDFLKQNIEKIVRKGEVVSGKRTYKEVHGGKIPVEVNATSVTFNGNPHILIVARDISLRIKLEEEINYRNSQMQILHNFVLALNKATSIKESYNILAKILLNIVKIDKLTLISNSKKDEIKKLQWYHKVKLPLE